MAKKKEKRGFASHPELINRKGRPKKGTSLTDHLIEYLQKQGVDPKTGKKKTRKDILAEKLYDLALKGDTVAMKYVFDRIEGKPHQTIEQKGDQTIVIKPQLGDNDK
jgi:hypothetical protein